MTMLTPPEEQPSKTCISVYNPRFPHTLRVLREKLEADGTPAIDDEGNPVEEVVPITAVIMSDGDPTFNADGSFRTEVVETMNFGYRTNTMNTRQAGDVIVSDYKIALPMFLTPLYPGDILEITDYSRSYRGKVVKQITYNIGSNIWFDEIKN